MQNYWNILYKLAANTPCCLLIPGNILIIECVVALLTDVNDAKVLLQVVILLTNVLFKFVVPDTFNDDEHVVELFVFLIHLMLTYMLYH